MEEGKKKEEKQETEEDKSYKVGKVGRNVKGQVRSGWINTEKSRINERKIQERMKK